MHTTAHSSAVSGEAATAAVGWTFARDSAEAASARDASAEPGQAMPATVAPSSVIFAVLAAVSAAAATTA